MVADRTAGARRRWLGLAAACGLTLIACGPWPSSSDGAETTHGAAHLACTETNGQIISMSVPSAVYRGLVGASVYMPPCYNWTPGKLRVIYLLHGGNTDETQWPDLRVQQEADALIAQGAPPLVVVMPGGYYSPRVDYEAFVLDDLIPGMEGRLRLRSDAAGRAIGGISLGGYWALKIAFQHPDLFAAVGGHSPVVARGGADDPLTLAGAALGLDRLRITLDAGDQDSLAPDTRQLADVLRGRGLDVALAINLGGHNRPYWRAHTADYLRFYLSAMAPAMIASAAPSGPPLAQAQVIARTR
jgi:enterochelin esterase-like enzyme